MNQHLSQHFYADSFSSILHQGILLYSLVQTPWQLLIAIPTWVNKLQYWQHRNKCTILLWDVAVSTFVSHQLNKVEVRTWKYKYSKYLSNIVLTLLKKITSADKVSFNILNESQQNVNPFEICKIYQKKKKAQICSIYKSLAEFHSNQTLVV